MSRHAYVLIDYDNTEKSHRRERGPGDTLANVETLCSRLTPFLNGGKRRISEATVRFYGGWLDQYGQLTLRAVWLSQAISSIRRRSHGIRLLPSLTRSLACAVEAEISHTCQVKSGRRIQKMVDSMLICDGIFYALNSSDTIYIFSNDADIVPGLITGACLRAVPNAIILVRSGDKYSDVNDALLAYCGVQTTQL